MPPIGGCIFYTAAVALVIALVLAFAPHQTVLSKSTYCYDGIRTLSDQALKANCFTLSSGKFSRVFYEKTDSLTSSVKRSGYVIPGLIDGHGHLMQYGELLQSVNIFGSESLGDAIGRVEDYLLQNPETGSAEEWIRGTGWDQAAFGRMPTAVSRSHLSEFRVGFSQVQSLFKKILNIV